MDSKLQFGLNGSIASRTGQQSTTTASKFTITHHGSHQVDGPLIEINRNSLNDPINIQNEEPAQIIHINQSVESVIRSGQQAYEKAIQF